MLVYQKYFNVVANSTYKEMEKLLEETYQNRRCATCGYSVIDDNQGKSKETKRLIEEELKNFKYKIDNLPLEEVPNNKLFNALYGLNKDLEIEIVNELLAKYNYDKTARVELRKVISQMSRNAHLNSLDISLIEAFVYRNEDSINLERLYETLIKRAILKQQNISYECFKEMIINFTKMIMKKYVRNPNCYIRTQKEIALLSKCDADVIALTFKNFVYLSEEEVLKFYNTGNNSLISTIFHECRHVKQYRDITLNKNLNLKNFIVLQESLIREYNPEYYYENYDDTIIELEANYYEISDLSKFLKKLGLFEPDEKKIQAKLDSTKRKAQTLLRKNKGENTTILAEFEKIIINHPELLTKYPQLNLLYKIENGMVVMKNMDDVNEYHELLSNDENISEQLKQAYDKFYKSVISETESKKVL